MPDKIYEIYDSVKGESRQFWSDKRKAEIQADRFNYWDDSAGRYIVVEWELHHDLPARDVSG
jgi:hypothetical protein